MRILAFLPLLGAFIHAGTSSSAAPTHPSIVKSHITTIAVSSTGVRDGIYNAKKPLFTLRPPQDMGLDTTGVARSTAGDGDGNEELLDSKPSHSVFWIYNLLSTMPAASDQSHRPIAVVAMDGSILADECWAMEECTSLFRDMSSCYDTIGHFGDPNDRAKNKRYQGCFCSRSDNPVPSPKCYRCMVQAKMGPDDVGLWKGGINNFCSTLAPSVYLFLIDMIGFVNRAGAPRPYEPFGPEIYRITTASSLFTSATGLNQPGPLHWSGTPVFRTSTKKTPSATTLPNSLLERLPPNWPYTTFGVAHRPGLSATYNLTDENGSVTVEVIASLQWYPKPLGKQRPIFVPWLNQTAILTSSAPSSVLSMSHATSPANTMTLHPPAVPPDNGIAPMISQAPSHGFPTQTLATVESSTSATLTSSNKLSTLQ